MIAFVKWLFLLSFPCILCHLYWRFVRPLIFVPKWLKTPRVTLITGASSGLGYAMAIQYARISQILLLFGRDAARLGKLRMECLSISPTLEIELVECDTRNSVLIKERIHKFDEKYNGIDLVIANAGIASGPATLSFEQNARLVTEVNTIGTMNTVLPAIEAFERRGRGQLVLVASIAGLLGVPVFPFYSASKAGLIALAEGLRARLIRTQIRISVVVPGFMETPMIKGRRYIWTLSAPAAARRVIEGAARDDGMICFPRRMGVPIFFWRLLPNWAKDAVAFLIGQRLVEFVG